jgi:hypothetical protein
LRIIEATHISDDLKYILAAFQRKRACNQRVSTIAGDGYPRDLILESDCSPAGFL